MKTLPTSILIALALAASAARAQADGGTPPPDDKALEKELQGALEKDAAANKAKGVPQAALPADGSAPATPPASSQARGFQSLNPDISAILDANAGFERRGVAYRNGDDPDLRGTPTARGAGFTAQEVELALSAVVDPYFKGEVYLTIPNLSGLEVEEAFATTTSLPGNFQIKAGSFRSAFGRQNGQHLHVQDFTRRPLTNAAFLGPDGLRGPGAQVSWLAPLPFYLVLYAEAFSLHAPDPSPIGSPVDPVASFGGGSATDLTYLAHAKLFLPLSDEWSLYGGVSTATGVSPGFLHDTRPFSSEIPGAGRRSELVGADLYLKWKPLNVVQSYTSVAWQTEAVFRHFTDGAGVGDEWDGGIYSQLVVQVARRWLLGVRGDYLGLPTSSVLGRTLRGALSVTFQASEFARVRAYAEVENATAGGPYLPTAVAAADPQTSYAGYLQLEFSIGAHGAHPF
jgi:hypothetical protein